jgi:hypothetical protein
VEWSGGDEAPASHLSANELDLGVLNGLSGQVCCCVWEGKKREKVYIILKCAHSCYFNFLPFVFPWFDPFFFLKK